MKYYGNVVNRIMENQNEMPTIEVGMGVTEYLWSDRNAYEVTKVINQKDVFIRRYKAIHHGEYGDDNWELVSDPTGVEFEIVFRYGNWYRKLTYTKAGLEKMQETDGCVWLSQDIIDEVAKKGVAYKYEKMNKITFGVADYYHDWSF